MSLFGNNANNNTQQKPTTSLFGNPQSNSLFGNNQQQQQQQQPQQQQQMLGLFQSTSTNAQPAQNSVYGQQQGPQPGFLASGLGSIGGNQLDRDAQDQLARSRLDSAGVNSTPRDKGIGGQLQTLLNKWDPNSQDTVLKQYLYNAVAPAYAPYFHPEQGESEREWEAALAKKPKGDAETSYIPVQVRGFKALGARIELQAKTIQGLQQRLHEMNNSLTSILAKHQQDLSVRIETSKKTHAQIAQRTLRLAVKCQVLRNRGYGLEGPEENLREAIRAVGVKIHDPSFDAREEQIWARMVTLRERSRWLEEESKRVGAAVEAQKQEGASGLPDNVIQGANRILKDYDGQLVHLAKELEEVKKEFEDWEKDRKG